MLRVSGNPTGLYLDPPGTHTLKGVSRVGRNCLVRAAAKRSLMLRCPKRSARLSWRGEEGAEAATKAAAEARAEAEACLGETVAAPERGWICDAFYCNELRNTLL